MISPFEGASEATSAGTRRIYPTSNTFTATGRATMHDPSIQMVPRDFDVVVSRDLMKRASSKFEEGANTSSVLLQSFESLLLVPGEHEG